MQIHSGYELDAALAAQIPRHGFVNARILVVGDLMLDRYIFGEVTRISPEAPVPVLAVHSEKSVAGGAANVVFNVAGLNAKALVAGVIGDDAAGRKLIEILSAGGVNTQAITVDPGRFTTCKTRVMCANHQIVRLDEENTAPLSEAVSGELFQKVSSLLDQQVTAVVLSDYAKGVLGVSLTESIIGECNSRRIPVLVDPKRTDYSPYRNATCITPNLKEFKAAISALSIADDLPAAAMALRKRLDLQALLVTQGANGMTLVAGDHPHHFPALAEEVFDVSGAGDTVIATLASALAHGLDLVTAVKLSNFAASVVVRRAGTTPIQWGDLQEIVFHEGLQVNRVINVPAHKGLTHNGPERRFYSVG